MGKDEGKITGFGTVIDSGINKELTVTKSNALVTASYRLTLNKKRLIETAIAKISSEKGIPNVIKIEASEFADAWNMDTNNAYKELKKAAHGLYEETLSLPRLDNGEKWEIRWLDGRAYQDRQGYVLLSFSKHISPYLENLKEKYSSYKLVELKGFKSLHSIRLYELLMQFKKTGFRVITINELRDILQLDDKYKTWSDFKRYVLDLAKKEIEVSSPYLVDIKPIKKEGSRQYSAIEFTFSLKQQLDLKLI